MEMRKSRTRMRPTFLLCCERGSAAKEVRVYLKTGEVTGSEEFSW